MTPENSFCLFDDIAIVESFIGETIYRDDEAFDLVMEVAGGSADVLEITRGLRVPR